LFAANPPWTGTMSLLTIGTRAEPSLSRVLSTVEPHITRRHKSTNSDARKPVQSSSYYLLLNTTVPFLTRSICRTRVHGKRQEGIYPYTSKTPSSTCFAFFWAVNSSWPESCSIAHFYGSSCSAVEASVMPSECDKWSFYVFIWTSMRFCACSSHRLTALIESIQKSRHRWRTSWVPPEQDRSLSCVRSAKENAYGSKRSFLFTSSNCLSRWFLLLWFRQETK
jgi:hypothetical protein